MNIKRKIAVQLAVQVALTFLIAGCFVHTNFCEEAEEWHQEQAAYATNPQESSWHEQKAKQFHDLAYSLDNDVDCRDWMAYRDPPSFKEE